MEKKKIKLVNEVRFEKLREGKCVQILHIGPYSSEPKSLAKMRRLMEQENLVENGFHHEIYLVGPGPRRVPEEKWRTILRQPVKKSG